MAVIALLTDFGLRDHYVGTMKGVILGICPQASLVDISHELPAHDVRAGALELAASYRYFPDGTVFLVVVDPGVGTARRAIAAEAGRYSFVAPDNGVLSAVFSEVAPQRIVQITNPRYARGEVSRTFEGRDRFAPAAAWLAAGIDLGELGLPVASVTPLDLPTPSREAGAVVGEVVRVDRFGNLVTNIDRGLVDALGARGRIAVSVGGRQVPRIVATYAEVGAGELCALFGSSGHLEVAANGSSAASQLALAAGAPVRVAAK